MPLPQLRRCQRRLVFAFLLLIAVSGAFPVVLTAAASARQEEGADVVLPRGDVGRGGAMPGAGPDEQPGTAWTFTMDGNVMGMAAAGGTLFATAKNPGTLVALDAASGEERWTVEFGSEAVVFGPALAGDLAVVGVWDAAGNAVVAVEQASGDEVWRSEQDALPTEPTVVGDTLLVAAEGGFDATASIQALNPETGEEVWTLDLDDGRPDDSVAVAGDLAFVTNSGDGLGLWAVDVATGEEVWTFTGADSITGNPLAGDGIVLIPDYPTVWALDAETGEEVWSARGPSSGGGAALVDGVAFLSFKEEVRAVDAASGDELWSASLVGIAGPAVVAEDVVYVAAWRPSDERDSHWIYAFDSASGDELWSLETDLILSGNQPIVLDGLLYVDTGGGIVALGDPDVSGSAENGGSGGDAEDEAGEYQSAEFGFSLDWSDSWALDEGRSDASEGSDRIVLTSDAGELTVAVSTSGLIPDEVIAFFIDDSSNAYDEVEVLDESTSRDLGWVLLTYEVDGDAFREYIEARDFEDGEGVWIVRLVAPDDAFDDVFAGVQADVALDGAPPFVAESEVFSTTGDGGEAEAGAYESPQYGYTLAYDPDEWEISAEDDDADDDYDRVQLSNGVSLVSLIGDPDYDAGELDRCLDDYLAGLEQDEAVDDVDILEDDDGDEIEGEEDGIAFAAYTYTYTDEDGDEMDLVRYASCEDVGDGVTFVVIQTTIPDDYEEEFAAREELMEGFEAA